jgi:hypothetical protein
MEILQTLLTVVEIVVSFKPDLTATCLAGFWPKLALNTHPKIISSTALDSMPDLLIAATIKIRMQGG